MTTYQDWHPGTAVAQAARTYTDLVTNKRRRELRKAAAPRTPDQQAIVDQLQTEPCAASPGFTHWIPPTMPGCVRPGCTITLTDLEATS